MCISHVMDRQTDRWDYTFTEATCMISTELGLCEQGCSQEFVLEGDQRAGSVTSGVHTGTEPPVGSGAKPHKTRKKDAENFIECHKFHTVQTIWQFLRGHVPLPPPCLLPPAPPPFPYAPVCERAIGNEHLCEKKRTEIIIVT